MNKLCSIDPDFDPVRCSGCATGNQSDVVWTSPDPRLQSSAHNGTRITLDSPPLNGKLGPYEIYQDRPGYGSNYKDYTDINGGQISYYIDTQLAKPFISQNFTGPAGVLLDNYYDPMGTYKPHYYRLPERKCGNSCLSFIDDTNYHRQDLLSRQLWKRNQTSYQTRMMTSNNWMLAKEI